MIFIGRCGLMVGWPDLKAPGGGGGGAQIQVFRDLEPTHHYSRSSLLRSEPFGLFPRS